MSDMHSLSELASKYYDSLGNDHKELQKVYKAWYTASGERGRRHTKGIYIHNKKQDDELPSITVYLDSSALLQDFQTDHILYEQRMALTEFHVKHISFKLSRSARNPLIRGND